MSTLEERLNWEVPYLTAGIPGTGGVIRADIEDFVVDEIPAYEPSGEGEHVYFRVEKRGVATMDVMDEAAQKLGLRPRSVSCAGFKDTHAVARQTFSVQGVSEKDVEQLQLANARILWVTRHRNKLRTGHLRGNQFTIRIRDIAPGAAQHADEILETLTRRGVPNAYGPQRFGNRGDNQIVGYHLLYGNVEAIWAMGVHPPKRRMHDFFVSALQSALFNQVVATRIRAGTLDTVIAGDVAKKEDTGGIFTVENPEVEGPRAKAWEISATGPIYGYKMMAAQAEAGEIEARVLAASGIKLDDFRSVKATGVRRPLRFNPEGLRWEATDDGLVVSFFAPKGSFATLLLRELMKTGDL
ncbi:MAG: tRNA pseudouridine(13) synthase TruD [Anaerolineae bacterium]|nr:tRNA pseudouridine(13) synthase TruD [Anaerolineae bacterium]